MSQDQVEQATRKRVEDFGREVGTLLLAFAPLEIALSEARRRWYVLLFFLILGAILFITAIASERRRIRVG